MEIISYLDTSSLKESEYSAMPLDELLHRQQRISRQRARVKTAARPVSSVFSFFGDFVLTLLDTINSFRVLILASFAAALIAGALCYVYRGISSRPVAASFSACVEDGSETLPVAMRQMFFSDGEDEFNAEGVLSEISSVNFSEPVTYTDYVVKSGDNISSISKKFGLTNICTLISVNNIENVRSIRVGQKLKVPSTDGLIYTVKKGDSLAGISVNYRVAVEELLDVNDMDSEVIQPGVKLFIPGAKLDSDTLRKALGELFICPISIRYRLSSAFGYRADPFTGVKSFHTGMDMAVPAGTPIKAAMGGRIATAGWNNVYGNYVIITHGNGYQTLYAHMQKYTVKTGQTVNQGTCLGYVGSTGYSTGPHLHFTVYKNGKLVDPAVVLKLKKL